MGATVGAAVAVVAFVGWQTFRRSYTSEFMDATWAAQPGEPTWRGRITRWNGQPETGQQVRMVGNGGWSMEVTDDDGRFAFYGSADVHELTVVGIDAIPLNRWNCPKGTGLTFDIHLKRPAPPSKGPL